MVFYDEINYNWDIRFSKYVGVLTLFDPQIGSTERNLIVGEKVYDTKLAFNKITGSLLLAEIDNARQVLGIDIDKFSKIEIIDKVKEYLSEQTKQAAYYQRSTNCQYS